LSEARIAELEAKVSALGELVARLGVRIAALEEARGQAGQSPASASHTSAAAQASGPALLAAALPLGGRTLLVLAGAFVLRALTDWGATPGWRGVALGLAYAIASGALAARSATAASATAHGVSALLVACPLLFELVARLHLAGPAAATAALAGVATALLLLSWRRRLHSLAWLAFAGTSATALALMFQSERTVPGALFLAVLGVETAWLGYARGWRALRWLAAATADLCALGVAVRSLSPFSAEGPRLAMVCLAMILALTLLSLAARTLLLRAGAGPFEVAQTAGAVGSGLGGAALIAAHTATPATFFGAVAAACGAAAYAAAFALRGRERQGLSDFPFFAGVGALLCLSGTALALGPGARAAVWAALAVAAAALAGRPGRQSLSVHAAVYALGSAFAAGLPALCAASLLAAPGVGWPAVTWTAALAVAAAGASALLGAGSLRGGASPVARLAGLLLLLLAGAGAAGMAASWLVPLARGGPGGEASRGVAGAARTVILVATALLLALTGWRAAWREAIWLAYAALGLTGLKILLEDLPGGRPATLVVSFGVYGAALLLLPRLRSARAKRSPAP